MSNLEVVGLGALNMDHLYRVDRILEDGETVVTEAVSTPGGSAANTIYGLARLGISAGFAGAVGDDADGHTLLADFLDSGVDTSHIAVKAGERSGSVLCLSDSEGRRSLYVNPGANNRLRRDDLDLAYLDQAGMVHVSSFVDDRQFRIVLELAAKLDPATRLSFSPGTLWAGKGARALAPVLKQTHVLFTNGAEMQLFTGQEVIPGAEYCRQQGCQMVVVTLGRGMPLRMGRRTVTATAYISHAGHQYAIEPLSAEIAPLVDTTGAGDAFASGFLYGVLHGKGPEECGRLGNIAAGFCITRTGARPGLPTRAQLTRRYRELYGR